MNKKKICVLLVNAVVIFLIPNPAFSELINVPEDFPTIKGAVAHAKEGDIIEVEDGFYYEKNIVIDKNISLRSKNLYGAVIDGGGEFKAAIFIVRAKCDIFGFVLKNCYSGIIQRESPDVTWTGRYLVVFNIVKDGISINDRFGNIGAAELSNVLISNAGCALATNDARGINVRDSFFYNCSGVFTGSNHLYFNADNIVVFRCKRVCNDLGIPGPNARGTNEIRINNLQPIDIIFEKDRSKLPDYIQDIMKTDSLGTVGSSSAGFFPDNGVMFNLVADIYFRQNDFKNAAEWYSRAVDIGRLLGLHETVAAASCGLARVQEKLRHYNSALEYYSQSIETVEQMRSGLFYPCDRIGFMEDKIGIYRFLIDLLYKLHTEFSDSDYHFQAFAYSERSKARTFLDFAEKLNMDFEGNKSSQHKKKEEEIFQEISKVHLKLQNFYLSEKERTSALNRLSNLENQYKSLTININKGLQDIISSQSKIVLFDRVKQELLDDKTMIIEYFMGQRFLYGFLITNQSVFFKRICEAEKIDQYAGNYLYYLTTKNISRFESLRGSRILYEILIQPFEQEITPGIKNLIIIPDGQLYRVPFETLIPAGTNFKEARNEKNPYLIDHFDISYGRSVSEVFNICRNREMGERGMDLLVVACDHIIPRNNGNHRIYPRLKYAVREAEIISKRMNTGKTRSLLNEEATEENLKKAGLPDFRMIHFITHGILDETNWTRSALVLNHSQDLKEDGLLHPHEIQNMRLNADLVTLSSCYTGTGKLVEGEGVLGLIRVFQLAGAQSLIASLWEVNDRSTSLFMDYFYRHLQEGLSKSSALRQAKLQMLKSKYNHPFYWAPFILYGDYSSIVMSD